MLRRAAIAVIVVAGLVIAVEPGVAKVKVRADFDKTFDFSQARTWGWNPRAGDIMVARTQKDDPEEIRGRAEPVIKSAVATEMPGRGLTAATDAPDLTLTYYLLLTIGTSAQTLGQFLPAVAAWGLPPFAPATTSYEVIEQGALVLDLAAKGQVVWRGLAEAKIKMDMDQKQREALVRDAVKEILKRYPPKK